MITARACALSLYRLNINQTHALDFQVKFFFIFKLNNFILDLDILYYVSLRIVNVVATADLKQQVDIHAIAKLPYTIHDSEIYGGRVTYLKTPTMSGKVTIFPSGKLISIGTKSPKEAQQDLHETMETLNDADFIKAIVLNTRVRNLVAVTMVSEISSLEEIASFSGAIYEPEQFPGVILKTDNTNATYLIFQSGKVVISGTSSIEELNKAKSELWHLLK